MFTTVNTTTTYPTILVPMDSDDLVRDIYTQLLELYAYDLEVEVLTEKLKKISPPQDPPTPYPWDRNNVWPTQPPVWYGPYPSYPVTCSTGPYNVTTAEEYPSEVATFSDDWDAWYDPHTNEWLENKCSDPTCVYCTDRPERPLPVNCHER